MKAVTSSFSSTCPFCPDSELGQKVVQRQLLFQTYYWNVHFDYIPLEKGHLIIVPKEHRFTRSNISEGENADLYRVNQIIDKIYKRVFNSSTHLRFEKNGLDGIPHFQIHVIPLSASPFRRAWTQIKLILRTVVPCFWKLSDQKLADLQKEFLPSQSVLLDV